MEWTKEYNCIIRDVKQNDPFTVQLDYICLQT